MEKVQNLRCLSSSTKDFVTIISCWILFRFRKFILAEYCEWKWDLAVSNFNFYFSCIIEKLDLFKFTISEIVCHCICSFPCWVLPFIYRLWAVVLVLMSVMEFAFIALKMTGVIFTLANALANSYGYCTMDYGSNGSSDFRLLCRLVYVVLIFLHDMFFFGYCRC